MFSKTGNSSNEHESSGNKGYSGAESGLVNIDDAMIIKKDFCGVGCLKKDHFSDKIILIEKSGAVGKNVKHTKSG